jgi:fermentation-respiration switch protein FrsA (DUF1100 family)
MKTLKIILLLILTASSLQLVSQENPVIIDLRNNGVKLDAKFYTVGNGISAPTVILLHGFPGNDKSPLGLAERLNKNGMNILVFNYEGSFNSEGIFTWENCMSDAGVAISFLKQKSNIQQFAIDTSKIIVCGCSLGAALALSAAVHNPEMKKIIAVAGGNDLSIYLLKMNRDPGFLKAFGKRITAAAIPNRPIRGDSTYFHNYFGRIMSGYEYFDLIKNGEKLKDREIFFITGWLDTLVPMEEFIIPAYRHLKKLNPESVSIKAIETDHNFTGNRDELANSIIEWVKHE